MRFNDTGYKYQWQILNKSLSATQANTKIFERLEFCSVNYEGTYYPHVHQSTFNITCES